ncbi:hypothetical protein ACVI3U_002855 [Sinorhizobium medicae]
MKSYSVKSNAKRFARGLCAEYPEAYEPADPVEVSPGAREWYPAVKYVGAGKSYGLNGGGGVAPKWQGTAIVINEEDEAEDASGLNAAFDAVPPVMEGELEPVPVITAENSTLHISAAGRKKIAERGGEPLVFSEETIASRPELSRLDIVKAAASLPPRKESSREEIEARRAERRQRIDAEKAAGTRTATGVKVKINKTAVILDLVKRPNGATQVELETATGWQRHTLRGYIAGTLRKRLAPVGKAIECRRAKGEETRYVLADAQGGEA